MSDNSQKRPRGRPRLTPEEKRQSEIKRKEKDKQRYKEKVEARGPSGKKRGRPKGSTGTKKRNLTEMESADFLKRMGGLAENNIKDEIREWKKSGEEARKESFMPPKKIRNKRGRWVKAPPEDWTKEIEEEERRRENEEINNLTPELITSFGNDESRKFEIVPHDRYAYDVETFFRLVRRHVIPLYRGGTVKVQLGLECELMKVIHDTGEEVTAFPKFWSRTETILPATNSEEKYEEMRDKIIMNIAKYQKDGSGWQFRRVVRLEIYVTRYRPLRGGCDGNGKPEKMKNKK